MRALATFTLHRPTSGCTWCVGMYSTVRKVPSSSSHHIARGSFYPTKWERSETSLSLVCGGHCSSKIKSHKPFEATAIEISQSEFVGHVATLSLAYFQQNDRKKPPGPALQLGITAMLEISFSQQTAAAMDWCSQERRRRDARDRKREGILVWPAALFLPSGPMITLSRRGKTNDMFPSQNKMQQQQTDRETRYPTVGAYAYGYRGYGGAFCCRSCGIEMPNPSCCRHLVSEA